MVETDDNMIILNTKLNRIIAALAENNISVDLSGITASSLLTDLYISGSNTVETGNNISLTSSESGVQWSSNNDNVATVNENGVVTGVSAGRAIISISKNGFNNGIKLITVTSSNS
jgi:uncharacterized protein YjdB